MSDLLARLRRGPFATASMQYGNSLCNDAADEIARLTARNVELEDQVQEVLTIVQRKK